MSAIREVLPNRRRCETIKSTIQGTNVYITFSRFPDGRIAEVFVDVQRAGTALRGLMSGAAIIFSIALQYGVPLQTLVDSIKGISFPPDGQVVYGEVETCTSILDYVASALEANTKIK